MKKENQIEFLVEWLVDTDVYKKSQQNQLGKWLIWCFQLKDSTGTERCTDVKITTEQNRTDNLQIINDLKRASKDCKQANYNKH